MMLLIKVFCTFLYNSELPGLWISLLSFLQNIRVFQSRAHLDFLYLEKNFYWWMYIWIYICKFVVPTKNY